MWRNAFEVVPLAPTSTHSGVVDHPGIECNPAVLYFAIFSVCGSSILGPSQGEDSSMYKMCLSLSEKMIKSGRELKADSPSPLCAENGVFFRIRVRIRVRVKWGPGCLIKVHTQVGQFTPGPTLMY